MRQRPNLLDVRETIWPKVLIWKNGVPSALPKFCPNSKKHSQTRPMFNMMKILSWIVYLCAQALLILLYNKLLHYRSFFLWHIVTIILPKENVYAHVIAPIVRTVHNLVVDLRFFIFMYSYDLVRLALYYVYCCAVLCVFFKVQVGLKSCTEEVTIVAPLLH